MNNSLRVEGIDSYRFLAAIFVMCYHIGPIPLFEGLDKSFLVKYFGGLYNVIWNGPAAVIVFFIISGVAFIFPIKITARYPLGTFFV